MQTSKENKDKQQKQPLIFHGVNCECTNCGLMKGITDKNAERLKELQKNKRKKLKDLPRYKVVNGYESSMKRSYAAGIGQVIADVLNKRTKMMKDDFEA